MLIAGFPTGQLAANCYVVAAGPGTPCAVIDPGEGALEQVRRTVDEYRLAPALVLLTHGHLDHAASLRGITDEYDVVAGVHPADDYMLDDPLAALSPELRSLLAGYPIPQMRPDGEMVEFEQGVRLEVGELDLVVDLSPGHTQGSVTFRVDPDTDQPPVLFTGDTLFAGSVGRTDLPGGSSQQLTKSLTQLLQAPDHSVLLPGHGPQSTIAVERQTNPYLADMAPARQKRWFGG